MFEVRAFMDDGDRRDLGLILGGIGPIVVAVALVAVRERVQPSTVALVLVVLVVLASAVGGLLPGAVAAVSAALAFNFFHTRPYLRLAIRAADDVETTALLLVVGLAVGQIAAGGRRARRFAVDEIRRIHRVAESGARGDVPATVIGTATTELRGLLGLKDCWFETPPYHPGLPRLEETGALDVNRHRFCASGFFGLPAGGVELPVRGRGAQLGRFVLAPDPALGVSIEQRVMAVTIADQVGAVLAASTG